MSNFAALKSVIFLLLVFIHASSLAQNCGDVITSDVRLTRSLHCDFGYHIFDVQADNVTIDLNGHTLSGTSAIMGINNVGYKNMSVRNGAIEGVGVGITAVKSPKLSVNNVNFYDNDVAINILSSNDAAINNNKFIRQSGIGVKVSITEIGTQANSNRIEHNEFYETSIGVCLCGADIDSQTDFNIVSDNVFWKPQSWAVNLVTADRNTIRNNRVLESILTPIRLLGSSYNRVSGNTLIGQFPAVDDPKQIGISLLGGLNYWSIDNASATSVGNSISSNYIRNFHVGIIVGSGIADNPFNLFLGIKPSFVGRNWINANRLIDNELGIQFKIDAHRNNASANNYRGTAKRVENSGIGNTY